MPRRFMVCLLDLHKMSLQRMVGFIMNFGCRFNMQVRQEVVGRFKCLKNALG